MKIGLKEFFNLEVEIVHRFHMDVFHEALPGLNIVQKEGMYYIVPGGRTLPKELGEYACPGTRELWEALDDGSKFAVRKKFADKAKYRVASEIEMNDLGEGRVKISKPKDKKERRFLFEEIDFFQPTRIAITVVFEKKPIWLFESLVGIFPYDVPRHEMVAQLIAQETNFMFSD